MEGAKKWYHCKDENCTHKRFSTKHGHKHNRICIPVKDYAPCIGEDECPRCQKHAKSGKFTDWIICPIWISFCPIWISFCPIWISFVLFGSICILDHLSDLDQYDRFGSLSSHTDYTLIFVCQLNQVARKYCAPNVTGNTPLAIYSSIVVQIQGRQRILRSN